MTGAALTDATRGHSPATVFPSVEGLLRRNERGIGTTTGLAAWLLEQAQVAVVPGEAFDAPGRLRLCFAVDDPTLGTALTRLTAALRALASDSARPLVTTGRR